MRHLGLFEGIGGFSLAARWMGWETVAWCEWDEFCQSVLRKNFPNAIGHGNIDETDFTNYKNKIDVITGGFPCQPYSTAGRRKGSEDSRHKWPQMLRAIRETKAPYIVGENVRGIINWNDGVVFNEIQSDLEIEGYKILPFLLPAYAKNADHERYRVWFVAYSELAGLQRYNAKRQDLCFNTESSFPIISYDNVFERSNGIERYSKYIRSGNGISRKLDKLRVKALGNSIVPQIAFEIFKSIEQHERKTIATNK